MLFFEGGLDEHTSLSWTDFPNVAPKVFINLRRLERINSCGVREWLRFANSPPHGTQLYYQQASAVFASQAEKIANFLGQGELLSFLVQVSCTRCHLEMEQLCSVERLLAEGYVSELCPDCGTPMAMELPRLPLLAGMADADESTDDLDASQRRILSLIEDIFAASPTCVAVVERTTQRIIQLNEEFASFARSPRSELVGASLTDRLTFLVGGKRSDLVAASAASKATGWRDVRIAEADSHDCFVEVIPLRDTTWVLVKITDLSLEASLHKRFRSARSDSPDVQGLIEPVFEQLLARFGRSLLGQPAPAEREGEEEGPLAARFARLSDLTADIAVQLRRHTAEVLQQCDLPAGGSFDAVRSEPEACVSGFDELRLELNGLLGVRGHAKDKN